MSDVAPPDFVVPAPRVEPSPRHVRVRAGETLVADSNRALLLVWYGPGMLPTYCLPPEDVRTELLQPSRDGDVGPGGSVAHDVVVGDRSFARSAHRFDDAGSAPPGVAGHWTFSWDTGLSWFEEALEVHVHARDPSKRVDVVPSDRHVVVELDGEVVAESRRPSALFETSLPTRWYLPLDDVRTDLLVPSDTVTSCPYKGTARYWSVVTGRGAHRDVLWGYEEPIIECPRIAGLVCFFNEKVDLSVDGVRQARPRTPWSD